jgi:hypothetical protein
MFDSQMEFVIDCLAVNSRVFRGFYLSPTRWQRCNGKRFAVVALLFACRQWWSVSGMPSKNA